MPPTSSLSPFMVCGIGGRLVTLMTFDGWFVLRVFLFGYQLSHSKEKKQQCLGFRVAPVKTTPRKLHIGMEVFLPI
nr:hypothetical protein [Tanacetum cinerariifolium]